MPPGHVGRPPPLQRVVDRVHSQTIPLPLENLHGNTRASTPSLPRETQGETHSSLADELNSFIHAIVSKVSDETAADIAPFALESRESHLDSSSSGAAINSGKDIALKRLLEPLIKNVPTKSDQPLSGFVLPPPPTISTTHLALRNVSGAYLVDSPCVSRPPPHFSISKAPLRSPRSLSPLARTVERLSKATPSASSAAASAASLVALPAMLQQPIDEIRKMAADSGVEIQSTIDRLQTAFVSIIVEAFCDPDRALPAVERARKETTALRHHDTSKVIRRTAAAKSALEDFEDMSQSGSFLQIPVPEQMQAPRPATQSSQCTPTPRSFNEGYGIAYELPLRSLKLSSAHRMLSREAAAEIAYKNRMSSKSSSHLQQTSIASMMSSSGAFDAPAAIWPSATLDSWPSNSLARVATSFGEGDVQFLQRESSVDCASDLASVQSPGQSLAGKVEMLRQCHRQPVPQFLQKIETDLDAALNAKGLSVNLTKSLLKTSADMSRVQQTSQCAARTPIFLDALVLLGAAFPTYRGLIMRIHGELAASFDLLDGQVRDMASISEKFHRIQQIHAEDLRRERDRVLASIDSDPSFLKHKGFLNSVNQQKDAALALQASNAEFVAQRRVKELEKALESSKDTVARLQEAVIFLRQKVDSQSTDELQKQHAKIVAHLRSIIKDSVHQDDHHLLKQQLSQLQLENARLLGQISSESKALTQTDDPLASRLQSNIRMITKKNFGTQTFTEHAFNKGKFSLLEIKNMILSVFPGLHDGIEELMTSLYGDRYTAFDGTSTAVPSPQMSSPVSFSGSAPTSPVNKLQGGPVSFGSMINPSDGGSEENDDVAFQKIFGLVKQSVDHLTHNVGAPSSPDTPSGHDSKRMKSIHSVARVLKSRGQHSEDEDRQDIPPSEREIFAYFKTNGTGKNVPVHLRTNMKLVKNRFLSKRECEMMVHQVKQSPKSKPKRNL